MTSDKKRREVARALRRVDVFVDPVDGAELCDRREVENALDLTNEEDDWYRADGIAALADLIDRPKAKREDAGNYWRCRHCGAFSRKDAVTDCCGVIPSRCCGNCGREWER